MRIRDMDNQELAKFHGYIAHHLSTSQGHRRNLSVYVVSRLWLREEVVRKIVYGTPPYVLFTKVFIETPEQYGGVPVTMLWGDLMLYETGEPEIRRFIATTELAPAPDLIQFVLDLSKRTPAPPEW
jgi:hypothetical protein